MKKEIRRYAWKDGKTLTIGEKTLIMGILNYTPDSFSDGGKWNHVEDALRHMEDMVADGADIIDIGAESTRPGHQAITVETETERLREILPKLVASCPVPISVDTYKADTAAWAIEMGAHMINDIWGLQYEEEPGRMASVAAEKNVPVIAMHNQTGTEYRDIIGDMKAFFSRTADLAAQAGLAQDKLIFDPGIGFGKTFAQNIHVMKHLRELTTLPYPMLLGPSRKRFIGEVLDLPAEERMEGTGAVCVAGVLAGCAIMRVHDVRPIARMCRMADALREDDGVI